ncbi:hypothetical protein BC830DRAFT_1146002, partial [Chytriomyces sp. MP71]
FAPLWYASPLSFHCLFSLYVLPAFWYKSAASSNFGPPRPNQPAGCVALFSASAIKRRASASDISFVQETGITFNNSVSIRHYRQ